MKRFVSMALAACMLLSMAPAAWAESGAEYCDALLAQYTTSAASLANAYSAQVDVIVGSYNPTGKLSMTMPACEAVVALTEVAREDGTTYEVCASPNDVPGSGISSLRNGRSGGVQSSSEQPLSAHNRQCFSLRRADTCKRVVHVAFLS